MPARGAHLQRWIALGAAATALIACTSIVGIEEIQYFDPDAGRPPADEEPGESPPSTTDAATVVPPPAPPPPTPPPPPPPAPPPAPTCSSIGGSCTAHTDCCGTLRCTAAGTCQATCDGMFADCPIGNDPCCIGLRCKFNGGSTLECLPP